MGDRGLGGATDRARRRRAAGRRSRRCAPSAGQVTRRLRSHLRTYKPMLERDWCYGLRAGLGWLGDELGAVRDLDVLEERFRATAQCCPATSRWGSSGARSGAPRREASRDDLLSAMRGPRYVALLEALVEAAASPRVHRRGGRCPAADVARRRHGRPVETPAGPLPEPGLRFGRRGLARGPDPGQAGALRRRVARARLRQACPSVRAPGGGSAGGVGRTPGFGRRELGCGTKAMHAPARLLRRRSARPDRGIGTRRGEG